MRQNWIAGILSGMLICLLYSSTALAQQPGLSVDPSRPAWLYYRDGRPFFLCGPGDPEDFLYRGTRNPDGTRDGDQQALIDKVIDTGANSIYFQIIRSNGGDGAADHNPFVDSDPAKGLDEDILDQWEQWFAAMDAAGIVIFLFFYDDDAIVWDTGDRVGAEEAAFVRAIVNRFERFDHLIWVVAEEYQEEFSPARISALAELIRETDDFDHPIAVHKLNGLDFSEFAGDPNIDQFAIQYNESDPQVLHDGMVDAFADAAGRYNLNMSEAANYGTGQSARLKNWAVAMGGAYVMGFTWDIASTPLATLEDCGRLRTFMESVPFDSMRPRDDLAAANTRYVLANVDKRQYIAYSPNVGNGLGLRQLPAGVYRLRWLNPASGASTVQNDVQVSGPDPVFAPPAGIGPEAVLYLAPQADFSEVLLEDGFESSVLPAG